MTSLKPLSSPTLAEQTADLIRKRILGGGFAAKAAELIVRHLEEARDRLLRHLAETAEPAAVPRPKGRPRG